ncbi:NYN domain-containing protein [uncultured Piscinibacter sp.]|uniref:NYN domain-containing protein n=1 Tax=uncultured Piscinibacter sp. TaxID=1131835 RepID=UPI0026153BA0|nr:NYN domain-containing protein [uncultured Piscinibacter sp.]
MALGTDSVAIYWDFENLHASLVDGLHGQGTYQASRFRPQDALVDVEALVEFALSLGPLAINRAFANWLSFNRYKQALLQSAVELIQVFPPGASAKNGADIKLCLDVLEDMTRFPHIGTIIVVGGDSDYMPLSYKVKAAGRRLVGIGGKRTTNQHWARSCHEFKFYEALIAVPGDAAKSEPPEQTAAEAAGLAQVPLTVPDLLVAPASTSELLPVTADVPPQIVRDTVPLDDAAAVFSELVADDSEKLKEARDLVRKALSRLAQSKGEAWVNKAGLRPYLQRIEPTFHESNYGFTTFSELLASMSDIVEVRRGEFDHELRLRP